MIRLGVITTQKAYTQIKVIEELIKDECQLTFLLFNNNQEARNIYMEKHLLFNGIIFSGELPYRLVEQELKVFESPTYFLDIRLHDFYQCLFQITYTHPNLQFSRVFIDFIRESNNYLGLKNLIKADDFPYVCNEAPTYAITEKILNMHIALSRQELIDLSITRLGESVDKLEKHGINYVYLFPSTESLLSQFDHIIRDLRLLVLHENRIAIGNITITSQQAPSAFTNDVELNTTLLHKSLLEYTSKENLSFIIQKNSLNFEIITSQSDLKKITNNFTYCSLLNYLKNSLPFAVNVGWGIGNTISQAKNNAYTANREAAYHSNGGAFIILENGEVISFIGEDNCLKYSNTVNPEIEKMSADLGVSSLILHKIIALIAKVNTNELSAEELSLHFGVTVRSANRLLNKLEEKGCAKVLFKKQAKLKGRPKKIYKIDLLGC